MATVLKPSVQKAQKPAPPQPSVILHNIRWETYESLLADHADRSVPHLTYDRGVLEIMSPLTEHEERNRTLAHLVEVIAEEWSLDIRNLGSNTFKRSDLQRGFEPDSCFYIQNVSQIERGRQIDLTRDPPPDLVIEIDITHPSLEKLPIYAVLGVPEVWRDNGATITILTQRGDGYDTAVDSRAFPGVTGETLAEFVASGLALRRPEWLRSVRDWARAHRPGSAAS